MEFEEEGDKVLVFLRTWDVDTFRRVCVATLDRYNSDPHQEVTALGRVVDALVRQSVVARPSSWKPSASIWAMGTVKNSLTTRFLIFGFKDGAYSGHPPVCSGV